MIAVFFCGWVVGFCFMGVGFLVGVFVVSVNVGSWVLWDSEYGVTSF